MIYTMFVLYCAFTVFFLMGLYELIQRLRRGGRSYVEYQKAIEAESIEKEIYRLLLKEADRYD